jgi:hypothetical protein
MPALLNFVAQKYSASANAVKIIKVEPVNWPDACLSAAQPGEVCAQTITPGYRVMVEIKGIAYELHTDNGSTVRMASPTPTANATSATDEANPAGEAARLWLMDALKIDPNTIKVVSVAPQVWPDSCLGIHKPGIVCASEIVPGFRVILDVNNSVRYELRTNKDGKTVEVANPQFQLTNPQLPGLSQPSLTWKSSSGTCQLLQAVGDQVAYGACGSTLKIITTTNAQRIKELASWLPLYHPFYAQTPAGEVTFYSGGTNDATPAQQRSMAEWAQMVFQEVSSPSPLTDAGLALSWHRVGGIAGFCDDLKIYRSGLAVPVSCKGNSPLQLGSRWLNSDQLVQLYSWLDTLQASQGKQSDSGLADSMTITWALAATGNRPAADSDKQAILNFASLVYTGK